MTMGDALDNALLFIEQAKSAVDRGEWERVHEATADALKALHDGGYRPGTITEAEAFLKLNAPEAHLLYLAKAIAEMRNALRGADAPQERLSQALANGNAPSPGDEADVRNRVAWVFETGPAVEAKAGELARRPAP